MISYDRIISEMERQLSVAKRTNDERAMREALAAVRSLCEVALNGDSSVRQEEKIAPKMLIAPDVQSISSLEGKPLEEEDANGGSLFDF
ncbi:YwdI family protein [Sporosarcina sp. FSL K6-2383]|uniref:YwdI family protein n=1 Tax=Sporosarcina sp. FSL K6-2383 TaxID=2921556 RepID=UPI00315A1EFE